MGTALLAAALVLALSVRRGGEVHPRAPAGTPLPASAGPAKPVPPALLGFNGEALTGGGRVWSEGRFARALAALRPQAIRVFGGTTANYWDWRTGGFVTSAALPDYLRQVRAQAHVTLADWARVLRTTGAAAVFDLNLVTSDLGSQLEMLRAMRARGIPVTRVELGNELYLPSYAWRFASGAAYGRVATRWIAAIEREFPGTKVAVDAFAGPDADTSLPDARERDWNLGLLSVVHGAAALSFHIYFASGLPAGAAPSSASAAERVVDAGTARWNALQRLIGSMPSALEAWVTEWNLFDRQAAVPRTWAHGLAVAALGIDLLTAPRIAQVDYHAIVNSDPFGAIFDARAGTGQNGSPSGGSLAGSGFRFNAGGVAVQSLLGGLVDGREVRQLSFGSDPGGRIRGIAFDGTAGSRAVILNLSGNAATVALPGPLTGLPYTERWSAPDVLVAGLGSLRSRAGTTGATLKLERFSLASISPGPPG